MFVLVCDTNSRVCVHVFLPVFLCACVCVCVRACVRVRVGLGVYVSEWLLVRYRKKYPPVVF